MIVVKCIIYTYVLNYLKSKYNHKLGDLFTLRLSCSDDLYFPCLHSLNKENVSDNRLPMSFIKVCFDSDTSNKYNSIIKNDIEFATSHTINKLCTQAILNEINLTKNLIECSEMEAIRKVRDKYDIEEDYYPFQSHHRSIMRSKKKARTRNYQENIKAKAVKEVRAGKSYRQVQSKYHINSVSTIHRWVNS